MEIPDVNTPIPTPMPTANVAPSPALALDVADDSQRGLVRSLRQDAWRRFRRNYLATASLVYLVLLVIVAVAAPVVSPQNPVQGDVKNAGTYRQAAWIEVTNPKKTGLWDYPLGTDSVGRDVLSRLIYGARVSLLVALIPTVIILLIGVPVGLLAGYAGGWLDGLLMRLTDVVYAFPALLFFIVMQVALRETRLGQLWNGLALLLVTLSVLSWTGVARLVRGEMLSL